MKYKSPGISLIIVLGLSFTVLGMAIAIIASISKSLDQSTSIERFNQIFFAAETGVESALFHHNARGAGVELTTDADQTILHASNGASVIWRIENSRSNSFNGLLSEGQNVQIPLSWDGATSPETAPSTAQFSKGETATLTFSNNTSYNASTFNFGHPDNEVLIDWSLSRKHSTNGIQSFVPVIGASTICAGDSSFLCEDEFFSAANDSIIATNEGTLDGEILPGRTATNISAFFADVNGTDLKFSFRPILKLQDSVDTSKTMLGIPFSIATTTTRIPQGVYDIVATVDIGDFIRTITITLPEKSSIGAFNYVIFN